MNRSAEEQLQSLAALKNDPRFAARTVAFREAQEAELMVAIGGRQTAATYGWRDYVSYIREVKFPAVGRSFSAAAAAVVVMLGGWITTVDAAADSLPGDPLYGFKLVTEQVQLRLASLERRAVLHTEFAERRLEEVVALQQSGAAKDENVKVAVNAFTREIASANQDLQALIQSGSQEALAAATEVQGKLSGFDAALDETVAAAASIEVSTEVQGAKDAARETQSTAVSVVVDTHEEQGDEYSQRELQDMFQGELGDLRGRQTFDLHRIEVVEASLVMHAGRLEGVAVPTADDFTSLRYAVTSADDGISEAMNLFAIGGYRAAFEKLRSVDGELLAVEARLAQTEIAIVTALNAPTPEPVDASEETDDEADTPTEEPPLSPETATNETE